MRDLTVLLVVALGLGCGARQEQETSSESQTGSQNSEVTALVVTIEADLPEEIAHLYFRAVEATLRVRAVVQTSRSTLSDDGARIALEGAAQVLEAVHDALALTSAENDGPSTTYLRRSTRLLPPPTEALRDAIGGSDIDIELGRATLEILEETVFGLFGVALRAFERHGLSEEGPEGQAQCLVARFHAFAEWGRLVEHIIDQVSDHSTDSETMAILDHQRDISQRALDILGDLSAPITPVGELSDELRERPMHPGADSRNAVLYTYLAVEACQ